jgi:hypothetical protein
MQYGLRQIPRKVAIAEVNVNVKEAGVNEAEALIKAGKKVIGAGSIVTGLGVAYTLKDEKDPKKALLKVLGTIGLEALGLYLISS